ncbi:Interferon-induced GTP-binding protein Mx [Phytophthora citrophthora]|uniref:Interferon-induced GTP-binding protein Mx n=1 Tax=Phytophthora citrophthora TaxID=4793 RepID=A0AAD9GYT6_9STRA|nr:Interferon-induced GTP-binding protein Mx [Phytophthora citrophthora]
MAKAKSGLFANIKAQEERKLIDKLRDIGLDQYIDLPQIAVMGDTSSGKSSLLSALSGVSFPSNDQLTTRCPTQLVLTRADNFCGNVRLVRFQSNGDSNDEGEEKEDLNRLEDVPDAITKLTNKLIDEGQYISDDQIVIEMCGPELPNLTLTDLPGLVRTVGDHEDQNIIPRVRQMVDRYMKQERTVIIAVVPANVDMHNTEILQAAQQADPNGTRTIAVVTKVDLVDAGAELAVHELLLNRKKKMHLGYHAVKCRSQRELTKGTSIEKGLVNETTFFSQHEYWRRLPRHLWGVPRLTERLVSILQDNIRCSLPKVIMEISSRMAETQKSLSNLGTPLVSPGAQRQQFGKWVDQYLCLMGAAMNGQYELLPSLTTKPSRQKNGAISETNTRLRAVLRVEEGTLQMAINETKNHIIGVENDKPQEEVAVGDAVKIMIDGQYRSGIVKGINGTNICCAEFENQWKTKDHWSFDERAQLKQFIRENRGDELAIFPSYQVFCNLFRQCVEKWGPPTEKLLTAYQNQTKVVSDYVSGEIHASSRVVQFIRSTSADVLNRVVQSASQEVDALLRAEARPYTQDQRLFTELDQQRLKALQEQVESAVPVDSDGKVSLAEVMKAIQGVALDSEDREALEMQVAVQVYLDVAVPRFVDEIPMCLNDLVLRKFVAEMTNELNGLTDEKLARLMQDSEHKIAERQQLKNELSTLANAKKEIELVC